MILSGQFPLYGKNTQFGTVGLNLIRQESGESYLFSTTGGMFSYNYTANISSRHHLVGGAQAGYWSRRIGWDKVTTRNQFSDGQINPGLDHGERFSDYQSQAFTTNVGLAYYLTGNRGEQRFHIGAGMINANKGRFTYLENDDNQAEPVRWILYSQLKLISNPFFELGTNMYWQQESGFTDFVGGLELNKGINPRKPVSEEHLGLGIYYSPDQTTTLALQLVRQNLLLGFSYNVPFGNKELLGVQNGAEVTLGWRMERAGKQRSYYGGNSRATRPVYQNKRNYPEKVENRATTNRYKANKKAVRAYKRSISRKASYGGTSKFSKKVSSYKYKANRKKPSLRNKVKRKSPFTKKYRKLNRPKYRPKKVKRLKPGRRGFWNRNNR